MINNINNDDDDFEIIPKKIRKVEDDDNSIEAETCIICLEHFTSSGDHKIVSLKCGHVFGQKCIVSWLGQARAKCPNCKSNSSKNDIRPIFINIPALKIEDNSELVSTIDELHKVKVRLRESELQCSYLQSQCNGFIIENKKLRDAYEVLKNRSQLLEHQYNSTDNNCAKSDKSFKIVNKLIISQVGDCRVMAYSQLNNTISVSAPSTNDLYPGFGVRIVNIKHCKLMKFQHLHTKMIRDITFSPYNNSDHMLTCGLDKYVKLSSLKTEKVVASYLCSLPVWSCAWSNNNYVFYAGLSNGVVEELDSRNLSSPISKMWSQDGGPVMSMRYISGNSHILNNGLLVTNPNNVLFLEKMLNNTDDPIKANTLLLSSNYGGTLIHTTFNDRTCHILNTFRPLPDNKSHFLLSQIGSSDVNNEKTLYASDVKSYFGGTKKELMNRSCFVDDGSSVNYVVCPDEESSSIKIWESNPNSDCVTLYPKDVSRKKPILDVCQYNSSSLSFAALNSNNLYLYAQ